jgi:glutathione reductase (NADPH)
MRKSKYAYDLFVIGAGSGGVRASRIAAQAGARVGICESSRVGGTCVIRGCIPKKILAYASGFSAEFENAQAFGWEFSQLQSHSQSPKSLSSVGEERRMDGWEMNWRKLIANKDSEINRLNKVYINLLKNAGVSLFEGHGRLIDQHTVQVGANTYSADKILIATGGWPKLPSVESVPGIEHAITSNEALDLSSLPKRVTVVGGGYIALEFAAIFQGCGADVTMVHRGANFLRGFDEDVQSTITDEYRKRKGFNVLTNSAVTKIEKLANGKFRYRLTQNLNPINHNNSNNNNHNNINYNNKTNHNNNNNLHETDLIMFATGRAPNVDGLGVKELGVEINEISGGIVVNEWSQTNISNIYAVGDVTNRINLTPVALAEGHALADTLFGNRPRMCDYRNVPSAVFSQPPVACVGLTEEQAKKERAGEIDVYISRFTPLKHTITKKPEKAMVKLIVDKKTDVVLGCHMVGMDAPEIMQGFAVALKCGATKAQFDQTIGIHPTLAEEFVTMRTKRS